MTELEKMQQAKVYIDKMANGIDPIDGACVSDSDMINDVRISRCLFYVSDILRQVINNNGVISKVNSSKTEFFLTAESISNFPFSEVPIPVSEMAERLNAMADLNVCRKLKYSAITNWLVSIGALEIVEVSEGKSTKRPTEQGEELGIFSETRRGMYNEYVVVVYNKDAQQFIIDNIEAVIANNSNNSARKADNQGLAWTPEHEECLKDLFNKNVPISEIAVTLKRTETAVISRLEKMGLIDNRGDKA